MGERTATDPRRGPRRVHALAAALCACVLLAAPTAALGQAGGTAPPTTPTTTPTTPLTTAGNPLAGNGMWIFLLSQTYRGSLPRIVAKAKASGVRTLYVKSSDGTWFFRQFTPGLISYLHRNGIKLCAWQYVYGTRPYGEALLGARAARMGADCLVIDAESEYERKYVSADVYITTLRQQLGPSYPISLAGFPYVHYHPSYPFSVFLRPGGAQYNQPQMYWRAIGTSVDANFATTYVQNRVYKRPIYPLGQTYMRVPAYQIRRFRQLARAYGAPGVSWWVWTSTFEFQWQALSMPVPSLGGYRSALTSPTGYPYRGLGSRGDQVVQAQLLLQSAGQNVPVDGYFGALTRNGVYAFQAARGLAQTGALDAPTWAALLAYTPANVHWHTASGVQRAYAARAHGALSLPVPRSASLPPGRREIPRKSHVRG